MNVRGEGQFWRSLQGQFGGAMHDWYDGSLPGAAREARRGQFTFRLYALVPSLGSRFLLGRVCRGERGELLDVCFRYE